METKEVVIVSIGALAALAIMLELWKVLDRGREKPAPYTARNTLAPILGIALLGAVLVAISPDKGQAAFGAILLLEVFATIFVVLGRTCGDSPERLRRRRVSAWSP